MKFVSLVTILTVVLSVSAVKTHPVNPPKCSCRMPNSIQDGFKKYNNPVFKACAIETVQVGDVHYTYTVMRVKVVFRGCAPEQEYIVVKSPKSAAACGYTYVPNKTYAVTAKLARTATPPPGLPASMEVYLATSCCYNAEWNTLSYEDKSFLYYQPPSTC